MNIRDAVLTIAQSVRDTGKPVAETVRDLLPALGEFSEDDKQILIREALASRVGPLLNNPIRQAAIERQTVSVTLQPHKMEKYEVSCQLLQDTYYTINGVAKSVASFTRFDLVAKIESTKRVEDGVARYRRTWEYVHDRLVKCKKGRVDELGEGEQMKIARMIYDLSSFREPVELAAS